MIDSKTGLLGLIGNPIEHSLSPIFMNYVLERLNINYRYFAIRVEENYLKNVIRGLNAFSFRGINVTIPFKKDVIPYLDELDTNASKIGAVNCILNKGRKLIGFNTDYLGFSLPIEKYKSSIRGCDALLIGCGGAARGVVYSLKDFRLKTIKVVNRSKNNALEFIQWAKSILDSYTDIEYIGNRKSVDSNSIKDMVLIINTTPLGMVPHVEENPLPENLLFNKNQIVYDIIYNPWETSLLKNAKESGARSINGFPMLIAQGLYSLGIWFEEIKEKVFDFYNDVFSFAKEYMLG